MRLIDADALTDEIRKYASEPVKLRDRRWDARCKAIIADMIGTVKTMPTIGGWISADKRPPKQGRYLVWGLTQFVPDHTDEPNGYWQTKIAQWFDRIGWDCKVKFWQMLPEPPKEVSVDADTH